MTSTAHPLGVLPGARHGARVVALVEPRALADAERLAQRAAPGIELAVVAWDGGPVDDARLRPAALVLSPGVRADAALAATGIGVERIARWDPGVDLRRFNPGQARGHEALPGEISVLHAGAAPQLVRDAVAAARGRDERLHLVEADPEPAVLARADVLVAVDPPDRLVLEAQASGVAIVAAGGSPVVRDGHTGLLCPADRSALAAAILALACDAAERARLGRAARYSTRARSSEVALARLLELDAASAAPQSVAA